MMSFTACPPGCKGPFADLTASRPSFSRALSHKARDEQRFQSVLQRLDNESQQKSAPDQQQLISNHVSQRNWPPLKPRDRGMRVVSDPLPNTTLPPTTFVSHPYPPAYSDHMADRYSSREPSRTVLPGGASYGPIAPSSGSDKRVSSA